MSEKRPSHPYGSTVEQVHRVLTTSAYREVDPWLLAEEIVRLVTNDSVRVALDVGTVAALAGLTPERIEEVGGLPADKDGRHARG